MDVNSIQLLETKEDEEGNVIMSFDMDDESSKMMGELGLKWKRGEGENYRFKIYRATYVKKRFLKRKLKEC